LYDGNLQRKTNGIKSLTRFQMIQIFKQNKSKNTFKSKLLLSST